MCEAVMIVSVFRLAARYQGRLSCHRRGMATAGSLREVSGHCARLSVEPASALVDRKVIIRATGFQPHRPVTIRSTTEHPVSKVKFEGHAHYLTDGRGVVSLPDQASLGGTYCGREPMGPFWGMKQSPGQRSGARLLTRDPALPLTFHLSVHRGHLGTEALQTAKPEAEATATRWYLNDTVERVTVHSGRLRGALYKPKGPGPFPGVVDVFGNIGGSIEMRASMLAVHGIACYALPYFNYQDLPSAEGDIELEYFKEAVDWLDGQAFVKEGGVGILGVSLGAQYAMATASYFPEKVRAVVAINGCAAQINFPIRMDGKVMPFIPPDHAKARPSKTREGAVNAVGCYDAIHKALRQESQLTYKIENNPGCHFLFVVGEEDELYDSRQYALEAMRRLASHGCHSYQLLSYPDAGHILDIPYWPAPDSFFVHGAGLLGQGGSLAGTAKAMEDSWPKIVRTLHSFCGLHVAKL